ncbi:HD-GYP domain-containing protein [Paenibacillus hexagrammi]|uniref:HD-GYP domain-containing protein n=1 Tax=Paenibacillus hexagrammi TaxID=2908839 RepID=A0ABY3SRM1_9BACL|nr:HD-GYP domain-containing protein [Paenibacillus sp. YPD9-1]UJF35755.1 HD-GYP domain-containing protein [Paenibacillus sp. YPD9-1]
MLLMLNNKDDYTYHHCVHVGMISYFIAKWLGHSESEALDIGKAGYLHDIGKSKIDTAILNKPSKLTDEEFEEMKRHTVYGYDIIRTSIHNDDYALTALQHHERLNGHGYPLKKVSQQIHPIAKIVAVADVYSAMITTRVYQKKRDLLVVLKEIHRISFGELDAKIAHTFILHMIPNFIGKKVILNDQRTGSIIMTNPVDYFRPLVQIGEEFIDLSKHTSIEIADILL